MKTRVAILALLIIVGISIGINTVNAQCPCVNKICPDGMTCSNDLQHCVCANNQDYSGFSVIELPATVYDFPASNQDFENGEPDAVEVAPILGFDNNPWFTNTDSRFNDWYTSVPGTNMETDITLSLVRDGDTYHFDGLEYFPIDGELFGNEGNAHNYHFTTKTAWSFDYKGGEYLNMIIDDGILVYINRQLVVNAPGLDFNKPINLLLNDVAAELGLKPGYTYSLHLFHMERHLSHSQLDITTNMVLHPQTCQETCTDDSQCENGICHPFERICHCQVGWAGDFCNELVCNNVACGDHGTCNPFDGKCRCNKGWSGDRCQLKTCNYHGKLIGDDDDEGNCNLPGLTVNPILECVEELDGDSLSAHFGYLNQGCTSSALSSVNRFTPSPEDRGQTDVFAPGRHRDVFQVEFDSDVTLVWTLKSSDGTTRTATASSSSKRCKDSDDDDGNTHCECDFHHAGKHCRDCVTQLEDEFYICLRVGDLWTLSLEIGLDLGGNRILPGTEGLDCNCKPSPEWEDDEDDGDDDEGSDKSFYQKRIDVLGRAVEPDCSDVTFESSAFRIITGGMVFLFITVISQFLVIESVNMGTRLMC